MSRRLLALIVLVAAALLAARYMADRGGSRSGTVSPHESVAVASGPEIALAAPDVTTRASALPPASQPDPSATQSSATGKSGPRDRLHGRVLPAPGRTTLTGELAVAAMDAYEKKWRALCSADGAYAFEDLEPGRYWLSVGSLQNGSGHTIVDVRGDTRRDIQLEEQQRALQIRVVDELGKPVEMFGLYAVATAEAPGEWLEDARVGATNPIGLGRFEITQRQPSEPVTEVIGSLLLNRALPLHVSLMRYQRVLESRLVVRGTESVQFVLGADNPLAKDGGIRLRAVDAETKEPLEKVMILAGGGSGSRFGQARDGVCEFLGLTPGTYRLQIQAKDHATERRDVRVPPGEIVEVGDVLVSRGQWIAGRILDETGKGSAFSIRVDACEADGSMAPLYGAIFGSRTDPDGRFRISDLAPGFHRLEVTGERDIADCVAVVDVRNGPVENLTLTVTKGVWLVVDPDGKHGSAARFAVIDEKGLRVVSRLVDAPEPVRVRLAPGRYTVEFRSSREDPEPRTAAVEIVRDPVVVRMR